MGVYTLGLIERKFDLEEIAHVLRERLGASSFSLVFPERIGNYKHGWIEFSLNGKKENIGVAEDLDSKDVLENGIRLSMKTNDTAKEVVQKVVSEFGGLFIPDDCADDVWKPVKKESVIDWADYLKTKNKIHLKKMERILTDDIAEKRKQLEDKQDELAKVIDALKEFE